MFPMRWAALIVMLGALLAGSGCGGDGPESGAVTGATTISTAGDTATETTRLVGIGDSPTLPQVGSVPGSAIVIDSATLADGTPFELVTKRTTAESWARAAGLRDVPHFPDGICLGRLASRRTQGRGWHVHGDQRVEKPRGTRRLKVAGWFSLPARGEMPRDSSSASSAILQLTQFGSRAAIRMGRAHRSRSN